MEKPNNLVSAIKDELVEKSSLLHFELDAVGGGSFFQPDDTLLATLQVRRRPAYRGRFVIKVHEPAYDLTRTVDTDCWRYHFDRTGHRLGEAVYGSTHKSFRLLYSGQAFQIESHVLRAQEGHFYVTHQPPLGGQSTHRLKIDGPVDLPLLAFYMFIILDPDTKRKNALD